MSEDAGAIRNGVRDIVDERASGRVQAGELTDSFGDFVIGTTGIAADSEGSDGFAGFIIKRDSASKEDESSTCDSFGLASTDGWIQLVRPKRVRLAEAPEG